jgi:hypothetical protein
MYNDCAERVKTVAMRYSRHSDKKRHGGDGQLCFSRVVLYCKQLQLV